MVKCILLHFHRIPEQSFKINHLVILHFNPFFFQQLFHHPGRVKMKFTCEHSVPVHYPVSRYFGFYAMTAIHSPANHTGRGFASECSRNGAIRGNPSLGNLSCYFENHGKEIVFRFAGRPDDFERGFIFFRCWQAPKIKLFASIFLLLQQECFTGFRN